MHVYQLVSTDGGRSWPVRRRISLEPHPGASSTGPVLRLVGRGARPAVRALEGASRPGPRAPRRVAAPLDRRRRRRGRRTSWSRAIPTAPSTTGTSVSRPTRMTGASSTCSGPTTSGSPGTRTSTSRGARPMAGRGRSRWGPGCRVSIASPSRLAGTGCWRCTRTATTRPGSAPSSARTSGRPGIARRRSSCGPAMPATSRAPDRPRSQDEYWNDMGAWQFGHPRGARLPDGSVVGGLLRRQRDHAERPLGEAPDLMAGASRAPLLLRGVRTADARGARDGIVDVLIREGRIAAIGDGPARPTAPMSSTSPDAGWRRA